MNEFSIQHTAEATSSMERPPVLGLTEQELEVTAKQLGFPAFVGRQVAHWIYKQGARDFASMSNLSLSARSKWEENFTVGRSEPVQSQYSSDGTVKYLFRTHDGHFIESVFIPDGARATLCISSQVGCRMGCKFCMTGRQGLQAQLSVADILNQCFSLPEREQLTNIVFMGQGEPLDNLDAVLRATQVLTSAWGWAWSPRRITISSVGLSIQKMQALLEESECHVAISLHHPIPQERAELVPAEHACSIEDIVSLLRQYDFCRKRPIDPTTPRQRRLSFEYIPLQGVNDSLRHAATLVQLLDGLDCRINLIPFHSIPDSPLRGTSAEQLLRMRDYLTRHGLFTTLRASRGQDISAACGLLSTKAQEEKSHTT